MLCLHRVTGDCFHRKSTYPCDGRVLLGVCYVILVMVDRYELRLLVVVRCA